MKLLLCATRTASFTEIEPCPLLFTTAPGFFGSLFVPRSLHKSTGSRKIFFLGLAHTRSSQSSHKHQILPVNPLLQIYYHLEKIEGKEKERTKKIGGEGGGTPTIRLLPIQRRANVKIMRGKNDTPHKIRILLLPLPRMIKNHT